MIVTYDCQNMFIVQADGNIKLECLSLCLTLCVCSTPVLEILDYVVSWVRSKHSSLLCLSLGLFDHIDFCKGAFTLGQFCA
jgi:hypothetical protein